MNPSQTKSMLKDKLVIFQGQDTHLFGKKFRQYLVPTVKAKKQFKDIFLENTLETHDYERIRPFPGGSLREMPCRGR